MFSPTKHTTREFADVCNQGEPPKWIDVILNAWYIGRMSQSKEALVGNDI